MKYLPYLDAVILPTSWDNGPRMRSRIVSLDDGRRQERSKASDSRDMLRTVTVKVTM